MGKNRDSNLNDIVRLRFVFNFMNAHRTIRAFEIGNSPTHETHYTLHTTADSCRLQVQDRVVNAGLRDMPVADVAARVKH